MIRTISNLCLSLFIIGAIGAVILYAYNLPSDPPGIQSAEHRAVVERHLVRK